MVPPLTPGTLMEDPIKNPLIIIVRSFFNLLLVCFILYIQDFLSYNLRFVLYY